MNCEATVKRNDKFELDELENYPLLLLSPGPGIPNESGLLKALEPSSSEFIVQASGIQNRYVIEKESLLDPKRMKPMIQARTDDSLSICAEISRSMVKNKSK